jgi:hypothetical protein
MDARRFRTEAWIGEYENAEGLSGRRTVLFGGHFFLVTFLWASKEKVTPSRQWTKTGAMPNDKQRPWIPAFAGMTARKPLVVFFTPASPRAFHARRAAGMDARRFRTEPRRASTKMPKARPVAGLFFSGRPFLFGDFFFGPAKKKSLGRGSGRRPALSRMTSNVHGSLPSRG